MNSTVTLFSTFFSGASGGEAGVASRAKANTCTVNAPDKAVTRFQLKALFSLSCA